MKKLVCMLAAAFVLVGCGGSSEVSGTAKSEANSKGQVTTVELTKKGDKITKIAIDDTYEHEGEATTKKTLKDGYKMKMASSIGKEWWEQIDFLEKFIVENGIDKVGALTDEGKPTNEDVLTGCTMAIDSYVDTTKKAIDAAK